MGVTSYFNKLKCIWDELDAMNTFSSCVCDCKCGGKTKTNKAQDDERLLQFLMGLNESYLGVRRNILMTTPLPSIGHAYSLVVQDEKQAEIQHTPPYPTDSASFIAAGQSYQNNRINTGDNKGQRGFYDNKRNSLVCTYCKRPRHSVEKCYRLHGYPADFKFTKKKQFQVPVSGNAVLTNEQQAGKGILQNPIAQLMQLLQQVSFDQHGSTTTDGKINANCAGPFTEEPSGNW
ncbi:uncharacterized protein LOC132642235 [Lycium barbarum]|uniref:uncharacterized protein LOC132642235 n=1 Tax=Lycium barbarum TaxID=112863 RepID=UPI00293E6E8A|nr:uncharacterized protein LOC132642235 [Lycium barbarum]